MGKMGRVYDEDVTDRIREAVAILRKHNKAVGLAGGFSPEALAHWSALDLDLFAAGGDWNFLWDISRTVLARVRTYQNRGGNR